MLKINNPLLYIALLLIVGGVYLFFKKSPSHAGYAYMSFESSILIGLKNIFSKNKIPPLEHPLIKGWTQKIIGIICAIIGIYLKLVLYRTLS
jgi:hypothetical protein